MDNPIAPRAKRLAATLERGLELLQFLYRPEIVAKMVTRVEAETPSIGAISDDLAAHFGGMIEVPAVRRKIGVFVAAAMEENGFEVAQTNVRLKDPIFTSGAVYRKRERMASTSQDLLLRMAMALNAQEAEALVRYLREFHPGLRK